MESEERETTAWHGDTEAVWVIEMPVGRPVTARVVAERTGGA